MLIKYGFLKKERTQRYKCKKCRRMCSDAPNRRFGTLRTNPDKIEMVIRLLTEGVGVRAAGRLAGIHRDTVLRILKHAGTRSYELLRRKLVELPVMHIQADEIWTPVLKRNKHLINPELDTNPWGDYYVFLAVEQNTKLLMMPLIGKRTENNTAIFANELSKGTRGRFQLTTDGFRGYKQHMREALGDRVDFAQFYKEYDMLTAPKIDGGGVRNPRYKERAHKYLIRSGAPDVNRITTNHVERVNLTLRTNNRRFNRKTMCISKAEEYLAYSVWLFVAHYNFARIHMALNKQTPAMVQGLSIRPLTVPELLDKNIL